MGFLCLYGTITNLLYLLGVFGDGLAMSVDRLAGNLATNVASNCGLFGSRLDETSKRVSGLLIQLCQKKKEAVFWKVMCTISECRGD